MQKRVGADISGTKISVARWVQIYRNVLAASQRASKIFTMYLDELVIDVASGAVEK